MADTNLKGKVIIVTGAAEGIGKAICETLVECGSCVVGCDINFNKLEETAKIINEKYTEAGNIIPIECDVTSDHDVTNMFKFVEEKFETLHALVSNAGIATNDPLLSGSTEGWMKTWNVNVLGFAICSREAVKLMKKYGIDDGHVLAILSGAAHHVPNWGAIHFYTATKHALKALVTGLKYELKSEKSHIRVSAVSPGIVETKFVYKWFPDNPEIGDKQFASFKAMKPCDVGNAVKFALTVPLRVNVSDVFLDTTEDPP